MCDEGGMRHVIVVSCGIHTYMHTGHQFGHTSSRLDARANQGPTLNYTYESSTPTQAKPGPNRTFRFFLAQAEHQKKACTLISRKLSCFGVGCFDVVTLLRLNVLKFGNGAVAVSGLRSKSRTQCD